MILNPSEQMAKGRDAQRKNDLEQIKQALDIYYHDNNRYPGERDNKIEQIEWGDPWVSASGQKYMVKIPRDPTNDLPYCYEVATDRSSYRLSAKFERSSDSQATPGISCGGTNTYNYSVTSSNL